MGLIDTPHAEPDQTCSAKIPTIVDDDEGTVSPTVTYKIDRPLQFQDGASRKSRVGKIQIRFLCPILPQNNERDVMRDQ
jgi:hypothetical protein